MLGAPPNCRPECVINADCPSNRACIQQKCRDPCDGSCGFNAECHVRNHQPVCFCYDNYEGDPYAGCSPEKGKWRMNFSLVNGFILDLIFLVWLLFPLFYYPCDKKINESKHTHSLKIKISQLYTMSQLMFAIRVPVLQMLFVENVMVLAPVLACLITLVILMLTVSRNAYKIPNVHMTKPALRISVWTRVPLTAFVVVMLNVAL